MGFVLLARRLPLFVLAIWLFAPSALTVAELGTSEDGAEIARQFRLLTRGTKWEHVREFPLQFRTYHPQGMTIIGDKFYITSVEVIDRRREKGRGHLFVVDEVGTLLKSVTLGEGAMYHPGGIDFDGERIWVSVAEYKPDSRSVVYTVDPETLDIRRVFEFADHLGGIVHDPLSNTLVANSWGSRRFYTWKMKKEEGEWVPVDARHPELTPNPSHYIDYQDAQWLRGTPYILCGGLASYSARGLRLGGVDLIEMGTIRPVYQVPVGLWEGGGRPMTQNPFYAVLHGGRLRFYFMPADDVSTMYVYGPRVGPDD